MRTPKTRPARARWDEKVIDEAKLRPMFVLVMFMVPLFVLPMFMLPMFVLLIFMEDIALGFRLRAASVELGMEAVVAIGGAEPAATLV